MRNEKFLGSHKFTPHSNLPNLLSTSIQLKINRTHISERSCKTECENKIRLKISQFPMSLIFVACVCIITTAATSRSSRNERNV